MTEVCQADYLVSADQAIPYWFNSISGRAKTVIKSSFADVGLNISNSVLEYCLVLFLILSCWMRVLSPLHPFSTWPSSLCDCITILFWGNLSSMVTFITMQNYFPRVKMCLILITFLLFLFLYLWNIWYVKEYVEHMFLKHNNNKKSYPQPNLINRPWFVLLTLFLESTCLIPSPTSLHYPEVGVACPVSLCFDWCGLLDLLRDVLSIYSFFSILLRYSWILFLHVI